MNIQKFATVSKTSFVVGLLACAASVLAAEPNDQLRNAALRVMEGRASVYATLNRCDAVFRKAGLDSRYVKQFWDSRRFEVFEGVRIALAASMIDSEFPSLPSQDGGGNVSFEQCESLVRNDAPGKLDIEGVSTDDLQSMVAAYQATRPDPRARRDRSLFNDCIKANFNSRQTDFAVANVRCICVGMAMSSVPQDQLDEWLARVHSGEALPMQKQSWFDALAPKLQACYTR
ncbi:hypothetical protein GTP41_01795 [Pseudoduganella sp. DS3]|uniref:Uncharacterized protein n=1 Tax=Pseudoduganella guangdongensis TaxID=2692179 RepID=A0A6N9HCS0_9BURK|nr:hypothetical protein [Pseudoduganella guangdongensis]MYN00823.1 hypothetical protein [Pseudoduganella guangdongensis]